MTEDSTRARGIIAVIMGLTFMSALLGLFFLTPKPETEKYLVLLIGCLITLVTTVINFYFGTSSGAKTLVKNQQAITEQAVAAVAAAPAGLGASIPTGQTGDPIAVTVEAEDPKLIEYRKSVLAINPNATEDSIVATWKTLQENKP